jgi:hypothetical protein
MSDLQALAIALDTARDEKLGVEYCLRGGLLDIQLQPHQARDLIDHLKECIKRLARQESNNEAFEKHTYVAIHRMSRMCWELRTQNRITGIDKLEGELLYEVPQEEKFEWVFQIFNGLRHRLRATDCSIVVADHVAKSIEDIMTS